MEAGSWPEEVQSIGPLLEAATDLFRVEAVAPEEFGSEGGEVGQVHTAVEPGDARPDEGEQPPEP